MPRTGGEQTREEIVRHAARLFRMKGYYRAGVRSILEAAGVSRGAFYFHFKSKRELGEAVVAYYGRVLPARLEEAFAEGSWRRGIQHYVREFMGTQEAPLPVAAPLAHLGIEFAGADRRLLNLVGEVLGSVEALLARVLEDTGFPQELSARRAATVIACFEGHVLRHVLYRNPECIAQAARDLVAFGTPPDNAADVRLLREEHGDDIEAVGRVEEFAGNHLDSVDNRSIMISKGDDANGYLARRSGILRHAAASFLKRGYHATGILDIARAASVPKGSFHYYFENKRALALEVLEGLRARINAGLAAAFSAKTWEGAVRAFCRLVELFAGGGAPDAFATVRMGLEFAGSDPRLAGEVAGILGAAETALADAIEKYRPDGPPPRERAATAVALWQGHMARMVIYQRRGPLEQLCEDLMAAV